VAEEQAAQVEDIRTICRRVKKLSDGNQHRPPIKLADGKKASTRERQIKKWQQYFKAVIDCTELETVHSFEENGE